MNTKDKNIGALEFDLGRFIEMKKYGRSDYSDNLDLYMITCRCQTKEEYNPEKKCMCTCSV